jgi:hypothetical protein
MILVLGLIAFCLDTVMGVLFGKLMNVFSGGKFNPLIGAAGISAFPMAARVVQKEAQRENFDNFLLMHAMGANAAGQVASVVAGGVLLALMGAPQDVQVADVKQIEGPCGIADARGHVTMTPNQRPNCEGDGPARAPDTCKPPPYRLVAPASWAPPGPGCRSAYSR